MEENKTPAYQSPILMSAPNVNELVIKPVKKPKTIAVIGGGIAGMEAAIILAKRGHSVTIFEKSGHLGGMLVPASTPSFKEKTRKLVDWYVSQIAKYPNIKVENYMQINDVKDINADKIVVATGAVTNTPKVKGIKRAIPAIDYLTGKAPVYGDKIIVIGGGLTGCEVAYDLIEKGHNVTIIESRVDLLMKNKKEPMTDQHSAYLRKYLTENAEVYLNTKLHSVAYDGVLGSDEDGKFKLKCSHVIYALGLNPAPMSKKKMRSTGKIKVVGNAKSVGNIEETILSVRKACIKM